MLHRPPVGKSRLRRPAALCRLSLVVALVALIPAACSAPQPSKPAVEAVQPTPKQDPKPKVQAPKREFLSKEATRDSVAVAEAQSLLADLGFETGKVDGILGPKTRRAINQFQSKTGLSRNGEVSEALLGLLRQELEGRKSPGRAIGQAGQAAGPAKRVPPAHPTGTRFVYSDGRVFTIDSADGDFLLWRSNRGEEVSSYRNFILPPLAWSDGREHGMRSFDLDPATLWPLRSGSRVSFAARHLVNKASNPAQRIVVAEQWACQVGQAAKTTVVAGRFDTFEISCHRQSDDGSPDLTRVWYYAPLIEHYVRVNDLYDAVEQDRHVELVAIHPPREEWPPAAQAGLNWALQYALESGKPGEEFPWRSSAVDTNVTISAQRSYERGDGKNCRNFLQTWTSTFSRKNYPGTACRSGSGTWFIPGLEGVLDTAER